MLGESLSFPRTGENWLKTVLIGGGLTLLTVLGSFVLGLGVVISPFLEGYFVRVLRAAANNESEPPVFDEWVDMFVDGIKAFVVQFVYVLPSIVLVIVGLFIAGFGAFFASQGPNIGTSVGVIGGLVFLSGFLLLVVALYFIPAALANFAYEDDLGAAFDLETVRTAAFTADYFVALLLAFVVSTVLGIIAALLMIALIGFFLQFYVQVAVFYLFGRGYAKGLNLDSGTNGGPGRVETTVE